MTASADLPIANRTRMVQSVSAFFLSFLATLVLGLGARDQLTLAFLALNQGQRPAALMIATACAVCTTALATLGAFAALGMAADIRRTILWLVLALVGLELLLSRKPTPPREPTQSLSALGLVLFAHQVTDAARLLTFALASALHAPITAGAGGTLGAIAALSGGFFFPGFVSRMEMTLFRRALGLVALISSAALLLA